MNMNMILYDYDLNKYGVLSLQYNMNTIYYAKIYNVIIIGQPYCPVLGIDEVLQLE
jgi:hypothetical protein